MKANELRIGNWVVINDIPFQVDLNLFTDWYNDCNSHEYHEHIKPIQITEDWLLKLGFEKDDDDDYYCLNLSNDVYNDLSFISYEDCSEVALFPYVEWYTIKHIHQLQNLYFALTNKELI